MTASTDEHVAHACVRGDRARADQGVAPAGLSAQLRGLVRLRDRLQSLAQSDHQRDAHAQRHAEHVGHRSDLRNLSLARAPHRPARQCRRPDRRRDRAGHVDDRRRGRLGHATTPRACARDAEPRRREGPRRTCARSSRRWCSATRSMEENNSPAGAEPEGLAAGDQPAPGQSRSGAQREPDRPADLACQPQVFRSVAREVHRAEHRHQRADGADADRHRSLQGVQRHVRPPHRRPGAAPRRACGEAERQGTGYRGALRRRGIRRHSAGDDAARGADGRGPRAPRRDDQGTDEALDRRASRPRHGLDRRRGAAARARPRSR